MKYPEFLKENGICTRSESKKILRDSIDSIPGVGMNTAARFIAEVSNVDRFKSAKALVAFAGTDPNIDQSGQKEAVKL